MQDELGGADVLVNNAGIMLLGPFSSEQHQDYRAMVEVNLLGAITATEVFLDQLKAGGAGDLVNISSVAGRTARAGNGIYAATKWGMNGWSESLRQELLPGVRVTLIEPGVVDTELPQHITHEATREQVQNGYDQATVKPEEVAEVIDFVLARPWPLAIHEVLRLPADQLGCARPRRRFRGRPRHTGGAVLLLIERLDGSHIPSLFIDSEHLRP